MLTIASMILVVSVYLQAMALVLDFAHEAIG